MATYFKDAQAVFNDAKKIANAFSCQISRNCREKYEIGSVKSLVENCRETCKTGVDLKSVNYEVKLVI